MASTFVFTLYVIVLAAVVIPGFADLDISNTGGSGIRSPRQIQPATLPDGYRPFYHIGVAYKAYNEAAVTWSEARERCTEEGANLAVIDTLFKWGHLNMITTTDFTWIGIYKKPGETDWISSTTELPVTDLPWVYGAPVGDDRCVFAWHTKQGVKNGICYLHRAYACELPIPENYQP